MNKKTVTETCISTLHKAVCDLRGNRITQKEAEELFTALKDVKLVVECSIEGR